MSRGALLIILGLLPTLRAYNRAVARCRELTDHAWATLGLPQRGEQT